MRRLIPPLLVPLLLLAAAACTPVQWARQDTAPEQLSRDLALCHQDAWREAQTRSLLFMNRSFGATTIVDPQGRTVVVPSSPLGDPFGDAYIDESRLTAFCMRGKGYQLVPLKPQT
jgi:hypothetical protein